MKNNVEISGELNAISPLLAGLEKQNVFTVPEGYFEGLSTGILAAIASDTSAILPAPVKQDNAGVPQGYFDTLADNILDRIKSNETALTSEELSPLLKSLQQINVYSVPAGYFDSLEDKIATKLANVPAADELKTLSPVLYSIQSENVFEVPQGYFDSLSNDILHKVQPQSAKLVTMRRRSNIFKYAAAAAVTGVMLFAGYKIINQDTAVEAPALTTAQIKGLEINDNGTFEKEMSNISDEAILKYLQASGEDVDAALIASTIDEKELPSREDYLLDDKTLDNFLNNIEDKDLKN